MRKADHHRKTNGIKATTAGSDKHKIAKAKRISEKEEKRQAEARRKLLAPECNRDPDPPHSRWPKRKLQSGGSLKKKPRHARGGETDMIDELSGADLHLITANLPAGLKNKLVAAAQENKQSINAELVERLTVAFVTRKPAGLPFLEFFAAHALSGICANPECAALPEHHAAEMAFKAADAMMEAREEANNSQRGEA